MFRKKSCLRTRAMGFLNKKVSVMKKLLLLGPMLMWGVAAGAQDGSTDQCVHALSPVVQQTDVSTVARDSDSNSAVIQLDVVASLPDGGAPNYAFSSGDGTITSDGSRATWTVTGDGPFSANVEVSGPNGCKAYSRFTYHMEQTASQ
jgi:hypothetical protein